MRGIHRSPVNSRHKGQWRGAFMFSLVCARINLWINNRDAGDLKWYNSHYDVTVMDTLLLQPPLICMEEIQIMSFSWTINLISWSRVRNSGKIRFVVNQITFTNEWCLPHTYMPQSFVRLCEYTIGNNKSLLTSFHGSLSTGVQLSALILLR